MFKIKRIYEAPDDDDGYRVLVDRLWPRGLTKDVAAVDLWLKDIAPSSDLRTWFHHNVGRWDGFVARYLQELETSERSAAIRTLKAIEAEKGVVTLLFAAREETHNHAALLLGWLDQTS